MAALNISGIASALTSFYEQNKALSHGQVRGRKVILYRVCENGLDTLKAESWDKLRLWQKIRFYFRAKDFSLHTIRSMVEASIEKNSEQFTSSEMQKSLLLLNKKITLHNVHVQRAFRIVRKVFKLFEIELVHPPPLQRSVLKSEVLIEESNRLQSISPGNLRGIQNPGAHCYFNSLVKGLWASVGFRNLVKHGIENGNEKARKLQDLFTSLEQTDSGKVLQLNDPSLRNLKRAWGPEEIGFKGTGARQGLEQTSREEDVSELLECVLRAGLGDNWFFSLGGEVVLDERSRKNAAGQEVSLDDFWRNHQAVTNPWVDDRGQPQAHTVVSASVLEKSEARSIQDFFSGRCSAVELTIDAIFNNERAKAIFQSLLPGYSDERLREYVSDSLNLSPEQMNDPNTPLPDIYTFEKHYLDVSTREQAPAFLPISIPRFFVNRNNEAGKNRSQVKVPFHLDLLTKSKKEVKYLLKAIIVHRGSAMYTGHYVCYLPDLSSPLNEEGIPSRWYYHSDSVVEECSYDAIKAEIETDGYLCLYDRLDPPMVG